MAGSMKLLLVLIAGVCQCAVSHHLRHHSNAGDSKLSLALELPRDLEPASAKSRRSLQPEFYSASATQGKIPYSFTKLDKMMKKAILQIILGDLRPADMVLLKTLNYTPEEVMTIREHELSRLKEDKEFEAKAKKLEEQALLSAKYQEDAQNRRSSTALRHITSRNRQADHFETYNKQAVYDYENDVSTASSVDYDETKDQRAPVTQESYRQMIDRAMEPHVVFKIRYDDSEFDSSSDERSRTTVKNPRNRKTFFKVDRTRSSSDADSFQESRASADAVAAPTASLSEASAKSSVDLDEFNKQASLDYELRVASGAEDESTDRNDDAKYGNQEFSSHEDFEKALNGSTGKNRTLEDQEEGTTAANRASEYEGLEWVGGDVYRVKPEAMEALLNYEEDLKNMKEDKEETEEEEEEIRNHYRYLPPSGPEDAVNDTFEYQDDAEMLSAANLTDAQNLTSYQKFMLSQRQDQTSKAIEEIKLRVLAMTGRFNLNLTSPNNQVQRERLTMFSPTCQIPRNTDPEAWSDPFSMNMHFQLNLSSGEHVLAAKLRLFKLPQDISAHSKSNNGGTGGATAATGTSTYEDDEEDEKKIRVSVYFYTKSLKKHRVKKRLMDSIVTPLTSEGGHFALDVRQALKFWKPNAQQHASGHGGNSGNHGLVVQVEDQDAKPLKPSLYIQEPSCGTVATNPDDKAYQQLIPAIFVRACTRYVRVVNGKVEMYVRCRPSQRH